MSSMLDTARPLKVVLLGDGAVGKTCLLTRYAKGEFNDSYIPTTFDNATVEIELPGRGSFTVNLWDTAGQEDYQHLRHISYPETDAFLVCCSATRHQTLTNVSEVWLPEIREAYGDVPVVLARTKCDLATPKMRGSGASESDAQDLAQTLSIGYVSTSSKTGAGVAEAFQLAAEAAVSHREALARRRKARRSLSGRLLTLVGRRPSGSLARSPLSPEWRNLVDV
mmetsp:Transcript_8481/g.25521  ORF Transcript_8481/g.25521 Transcript_8481/m.25521 type:complete len:224 (+) Transcript_8481:287-958(+)|eukprot:CAMPEP_0119272526 /NCGR_PEP_ID=MMETSP1329-20130426/8657_1 /TAXON_ID=114041 /ORGANISM="Genus nov. species nov., Strain RCC1024" /LENGTH=223 /DNA_ID=CAMNT_0007272593 /DNA_START=263 /DNA_END=934 /DNA_ORIENTATION=+